MPKSKTQTVSHSAASAGLFLALFSASCKESNPNDLDAGVVARGVSFLVPVTLHNNSSEYRKVSVDSEACGVTLTLSNNGILAPGQTVEGKFKLEALRITGTHMARVPIQYVGPSGTVKVVFNVSYSVPRMPSVIQNAIIVDSNGRAQIELLDLVEADQVTIVGEGMSFVREGNSVVVTLNDASYYQRAKARILGDFGQVEIPIKLFPYKKPTLLLWSTVIVSSPDRVKTVLSEYEIKTASIQNAPEHLNVTWINSELRVSFDAHYTCDKTVVINVVAINGLSSNIEVVP